MTASDFALLSLLEQSPIRLQRILPALGFAGKMLRLDRPLLGYRGCRHVPQATQVVMLMLDQVEGDQHGLVIGMLNVLLTLIGAASLMHRSWFISAVHDDGD